MPKRMGPSPGAQRSVGPVRFSDEQLARASEDSGFSVEELRAYLAEHPVTEAELEDTARFVECVRRGERPLTYIKL